MRKFKSLFDLKEIFRLEGREETLSNIFKYLLLERFFRLGVPDSCEGWKLPPSYLFEIFRCNFLSIVTHHPDHLLHLLICVRLIDALQEKGQLVSSQTPIAIDVNHIESLPYVVIGEQLAIDIVTCRLRGITVLCCYLFEFCLDDLFGGRLLEMALGSIDLYRVLIFR